MTGGARTRSVLSLRLSTEGRTYSALTRGGITSRCSGPGGRRGPRDSEVWPAPARPLNVGPLDPQGDMAEEIEIAEYDTRWPARFVAEAEQIRRLLDTPFLEIEHHGSTAVPGLAAKPVIDMLVAVDSIGSAEQYAAMLVQNGYAKVNGACGKNAGHVIVASPPVRPAPERKVLRSRSTLIAQILKKLPPGMLLVALFQSTGGGRSLDTWKVDPTRKRFLKTESVQCRVLQLRQPDIPRPAGARNRTGLTQVR